MMNKTSSRRYVVVKRRSAIDLESFREVVLLREFRHHPCVVKFLDAYLSKDQLCIVLHYYPRGDLAQEIANRTQPIALSTAQSWIAQIGLAMHALHRHDVLHRDVKPANVFMLSSSRVVLGDLGVSKVGNLADTTLGSPYYMSPECLQGYKYGKPSDIWAFGCLVFEILTLQRAFEASTLAGLRENVGKGRLQWERVNIQPNHHGKNLVEAMLQQRPGHRATAGKVLNHDFVRDGLHVFLEGIAQGRVPIKHKELAVLIKQLRCGDLEKVATGLMKV